MARYISGMIFTAMIRKLLQKCFYKSQAFDNRLKDEAFKENYFG
jgi:hypothetical protein